MDVTAERRSKTTLSGFVLGVAATGAIMSAGLLTLIIVLNKVALVENGYPSLSSQLMIALIGLIFAMGLFIFLGSLGIWRLSVKGGGVNLGLGIVLLTLSQGLLILLPEFVPVELALWTFLNLLYYMMGIASTLSGISGLIAYFTKEK